jgi:hypothetical protein
MRVEQPEFLRAVCRNISRVNINHIRGHIASFILKMSPCVAKLKRVL